MADPSTWPSRRKSLQGHQVESGKRLRQLPGAPNLQVFYDRQRGALQEAITRGRRLARRQSATLIRQYDIAGVGTLTTATPGFGLNRQHRSVIESRLSWWANAIDRDVGSLARTTTLAADAHYEPPWNQIRRDLKDLSWALGRSLYSAIDDHLGRQALAALDAWPYKTGLSRAMLFVEIMPGMTRDELMQASFQAGAGYSGYIKEGGFKVVRSTYTDKQGRERVRRKHVYSDEARLPAWKARYLVQTADGRWRFDTDAYERRKAAGGKLEMEADYKAAKGKPYRDLMTKPAPRTVRAIGDAAIAGTIKEAP